MLFLRTFLICATLFIIACKKNGGTDTSQVTELIISDITHIRDTVTTTLKFVVTASPVSNKSITLDYSTIEGSAKADIDYIPVSGRLTISPNTSQVTAEIKITGRKLVSGSQQFTIKISNAVNAVIKNAEVSAVIRNPGFGYILVWEDEFDSTALNTGDWNYESGGNGWGNNELQNYTAGLNNAYIENGNLVIEAKKENAGSNSYTSARLTTKGKRKFTYGKIDIRAKIPATTGLWPALWMLGENIDQVSWPNCGEIDILEFINKEQPSRIFGTAHWGSSGVHQSSGGNFALSSGYFSDDFHVYTIEWDKTQIKWFMDNNQFYQLSRSNVSGDPYPFDKDFFLIMNVAVGGNWPGNPDATSVFPQKMLVDYVKVYQQ